MHAGISAVHEDCGLDEAGGYPHGWEIGVFENRITPHRVAVSGLTAAGQISRCAADAGLARGKRAETGSDQYSQYSDFSSARLFQHSDRNCGQVTARALVRETGQPRASHQLQK